MFPISGNVERTNHPDFNIKYEWVYVMYVFLLFTRKKYKVKLIRLLYSYNFFVYSVWVAYILTIHFENFTKIWI